MDFVKKVINKWDPIDLMSYCPSDEYQNEIEVIYNFLLETNDLSELSEEIYKVFVNSFGKDVFSKSLNECQFIAKTLLKYKNEL